MDILTLSLAVQKALRELGVKTEPGKVLLKETTASYGVVTEYIGLAVGKTYNVSFLGGTFQAVCKAMEEIRYVGNLSLLIEDAENTGEAFCIAEVVEDGENGTVWSFSVEGEEFTVSTPETIHPIDPKFLPGVCLPVVVDFDVLGLTAPILELVNTNGGMLKLQHENDYGVNIEEVAQAFPNGKVYCASITIPDLGRMNVYPVYNSYDHRGLLAVHFDSYVYNVESGLIKFFVRIEPYYHTADTIELVNIGIRVGFF